MKIRNGFVSNSSSSSYVITFADGLKNYPKEDGLVKYYEERLNDELSYCNEDEDKEYIKEMREYYEPKINEAKNDASYGKRIVINVDYGASEDMKSFIDELKRLGIVKKMEHLG